MDELTARIREYAQDGSDMEISAVAVGKAIEQFRDIRNYPSRYDEMMILEDMKRYQYTIAERAVEIASKVGAEGQTGHSENGVSRVYKEGSIAYQDLVGFVR